MRYGIVLQKQKGVIPEVTASAARVDPERNVCAGDKNTAPQITSKEAVWGMGTLMTSALSCTWAQEQGYHQLKKKTTRVLNRVMVRATEHLLASRLGLV